jgi:hypothetical protein
MKSVKIRLQTCDRFLKRIKNKPEYSKTYTMFKAIRMDLAKQIKNKETI